MGTQKPISAKIDTTVLKYCKANGGKLNTLINDLLRGWMEKNKQKQLIAFQVETGTDELSQLGTTLKCSQCCNNCNYQKETTINAVNCRKTGILSNLIKPTNFCCIYWEKKKKGSN